MTAETCQTPLPLADVIDYAIGELPDDRQQAFEAHLFECEPCSRLLDSTVRLGNAVAGAVGDGQLAVAGTVGLVLHASNAGTRIRQYRLAPGESVACTIAPEESAVAIRLGGMPPGATAVTLDIALDDLDGQTHADQRVEDVPIDLTTREVVLISPGARVRAYPRSRWTIRARTADSEREIGPFVLDHTPWARLAHPG